MSLDTRNAELDEKLENNSIDATIASLAAADRQRKRQIFLLAVSLVFDLVLSVLLAFGWSTNHKLINQAESNRNAIIRNCQTSNDARKNNREIWDYVLELTKDAPRDRQQSINREQFIKQLDMTFAPRDCDSPDLFKQQ